MKLSRHRPAAVATAASTVGLFAALEALGLAYAPPAARALVVSAMAGTAAALTLFLARRHVRGIRASVGSGRGPVVACADARHQDHFPMDDLRSLLLRSNPPSLNSCYRAWALALQGHDAPGIMGLLGLPADAACLLVERAATCRSPGPVPRTHRTPRSRIRQLERRREVRKAAQRLTERPPHVSADAVLSDLDACIASLHQAAVDAWRTGIPLQDIAQDAQLSVNTVQQWIASHQARQGIRGAPGSGAGTLPPDATR